MKLKKIWVYLVLLISTSVVNASIVGIDTSIIPGGKLNLGDMVILKVYGADFTQATIGGGVNLNFEPSVLRVDEVIFDNSVFDFQKQVNSIDNDLGLVESILVSSILSEHAGEFTIAEIKFTAIGAGLSDLILSPSTFFAPWRTASNQDIDFDFVDGSVQVVPLPAAIWLFGAGLIGLLVTTRNRVQSYS